LALGRPGRQVLERSLRLFVQREQQPLGLDSEQVWEPKLPEARGLGPVGLGPVRSGPVRMLRLTPRWFR
jgi:hypothetical protein